MNTRIDRQLALQALRAAGLLVGAQLLFLAACSSSDDTNAAPTTTQTYTTSNTTSTTGGGGGDATTATTGTGTGGSGTGGSGGVLDCDGPNGCYDCPPQTDKQFHEACTDANCSPFDDVARLPLYNNGNLPAIP